MASSKRFPAHSERRTARAHSGAITSRRFGPQGPTDLGVLTRAIHTATGLDERTIHHCLLACTHTGDITISRDESQPSGYVVTPRTAFCRAEAPSRSEGGDA